MKGRTPRARGTAPSRSRLAATVVAILLPAALPARGADTPSLPPALVSAVPVQLAGSADVDRLVVRLEELLTGVGAVVKVVRVATTDPVAALGTDIGDRDRPAAWVVVAQGKAHVRVAGPGRIRFIQRELAVKSPLSQLDGERIGHALRSALSTILEADAEQWLELAASHEAPAPALADSDEQAASAAPEARRALRATPEIALSAPASAPPSSPSSGRPRWDVGALWEVQRVTLCRCGGAPRPAAFLQGVGATLAAVWNRVRLQPELLVSGQYHLPLTIGTIAGETTLSGFSLHLDGSVRVRPAVHLGLGVGLDRMNLSVDDLSTAPQGSIVPFSPQVRGLGRVFLRFGPHATGPIDVSAVLLLEVTRSGTEQRVYWFDQPEPDPIYQDARVRPGLAIDLRWR
jgi:hypothetical protein